jgi:hypothetical protein
VQLAERACHLYNAAELRSLRTYMSTPPILRCNAAEALRCILSLIVGG